MTVKCDSCRTRIRLESVNYEKPTESCSELEQVGGRRLGGRDVASWDVASWDVAGWVIDQIGGQVGGLLGGELHVGHAARRADVQRVFKKTRQGGERVFVGEAAERYGIIRGGRRLVVFNFIFVVIGSEAGRELGRRGAGEVG